MPDLRTALDALPYHDVRAIATRLGARRRGEHRKAAWITAIVAAWTGQAEAPDQCSGPEHLLPAGGALHSARAAPARAMPAPPGRRSGRPAPGDGSPGAPFRSLSPAARAAASRLAQAGGAPAALFLGEYGEIRRARRAAGLPQPPWDAPASISEELFYAGLLAAPDGQSFDAALWLSLPDDLVSLAAGAPRPRAAAPALPAAAAARLLHDAAQALVFLESLPRPLLHGRWLPPAALALLNARLLRPDPPGALRSHRRAPRSRLLFFLLRAAGLEESGQITPLGRAWLAEPPAPRLALLWQAWRQAPQPLRRAYVQPAGLPCPWPELLLDALVAAPGPLDARTLAGRLMAADPALAPFFAAHLHGLSALDRLVEATLSELRNAWGAVRLRSGGWSLSATGRWLADPVHAPAGEPDLAPASPAAATLAWCDPDGCRITLDAGASPGPWSALARAAASVRLAGSPPAVTFELTAASVAAAAAHGEPLAVLSAACVAAGLPDPPDPEGRLAAWHAQGRRLRLQPALLLLAADPGAMQQVCAAPGLRPLLAEVFSPRAALLAAGPESAGSALREAGFHPDESALPPLAGGGAGDDPAALWLASRVYALLAGQIAVPLPPPHAAARRLLEALPLRQQLAAHAAWEALLPRWQALLDGETFAPPPSPAGPEETARWQAIAARALEEGRDLRLRYYTASRGVITERTVTPEWLENRSGAPYLYAFCHSANAMRTFRFDRIRSLALL
jgi:hypothetical protein